MEYKPALGEPYRPVLSAPSRISSLLPNWSRSSCIIPAALFNGVDPPRALKPAEILTPRVTQALPSASMAATAAPASGIRANEPRETFNPSTIGPMGISILSDPETRESGSELSDPSSPDPDHINPKNTNRKASGSEDSDINRSDSNKVGPQGVRPVTPELGKGAAGASEPKTHPEFFDPKHATLQTSDPQDAEHQALDGQNKPGTGRSSNPEMSMSHDLNTDSSSSDRSQPHGLIDSPSNTAKSSNQKSKILPPHDYNPYLSNSNIIDIPDPDSRDAEAAGLDTENPDSHNDQTKFKGKGAAVSPSKSPATDPEANGEDKLDLKSTDDEIDLFHVLPTELFNTHEALSLSAKPSDGGHSTPNDSEQDPSSPLNSSKYPPSGPDLSREDRTLENTLTLQNPDAVLPSKGLDAMADLPAMTASAHDSTSSPQHLAGDPPSGDSEGMEGSCSKTTTTDASPSVTVAVKSPETSRYMLSSARVAATALRLGGGAFGDTESQVANDSSKAKSSAATLFAARRYPASSILIRVQELLYKVRIQVLPWLLLLL